MSAPAFKRLGKYEIVAELGRGGFGTVFRAFDPTVGRMVAIKVLMSEAGKDVLARFRNEAAAAGNLRHENIVTIYEFGDDKGVSFIVMEHLEGEDLQQVLASGKPLTLLEKISIMTQSAAGLDCAHRHGVVHRDVKPANIRLLPDGRVKIMDFGIARLVRGAGSARLTRQGHLLGTLLYMAPEQLMGSESDALSDIFAYGVTFYELLTGRHPFQAEDPRSVFYKITSEDPELIHDLVPDCPETLDHVIRRALHKERELRYQSLRDLRVDVEPVLIALRKERATTLVSSAHRLTGERSFDEALALLNEAIDLDSANDGARDLRETVQAELRRRLVRPRIEALLVKAERSLAEDNYGDAIQVLEAAIQLDPHDPSLQARSREAQLRRDQYRESRRLMAEARAELGRGNLATALDGANAALSLHPASAEGRALLETIEAEIQSRERHRRLEEQLRAAQDLLSRDALEEAMAILDALEPDQRDTPEAVDVAECLAARRAEIERRQRLESEQDAAGSLHGEGQFRDAAGLLQRLSAEFPGESRVTELLAEARRQTAAFEKAQSLERLQTEALRHAESRRFEEALELIQSAANEFRGEPIVAELREKVAHAKEAWERQQAIEQAIRDCETLAREHRFDEALSGLRAARRTYPEEESLRALERELRANAIAATAFEARKLAQALQFTRALELIAAAAESWSAEAELASVKREIEAAAAVAEAHAQIEQERPCDAVQTLGRARAEYGGSAALDQALSEAQHAIAAQERDRAREQEIAAAAAECERLCAARKFAEAMETADVALEMYPGAPALEAARSAALHGLEGQRRAAEIAECIERASELRAAGNPRDAVKQLEAAIHCLDADAGLETALAGARADVEALERAEALARAAAEKEARARVREVVSQCADLIGAGDLAKAGRVLQSGLREFPDDRELAAMQQTIKAESEKRRRVEAIRRAAENARSLLERGQTARAVELLEAAAVQYPGDPVILDALAQAREAKRGGRPADLVDAVCRETKLYLEKNDFDRALRAVTMGLETMSGEERLVRLKETVIAARRQFDRGLRRKRTPAPVAQAVTDDPSISMLAPEVSTAPAPGHAMPAVAGRTIQAKFVVPAAIGCGLVLVAILGATRMLRPNASSTALTVETEPAGAAIEIDGKPCTASDCRVELSAGSHRIDARLPGYAAASQVATVGKGQARQVRIALTPLPTSLIVTSNFADGAVEVDGRAAGRLTDGQLTLNLQPGSHALRIAGPDGEASFSVKTAVARPPDWSGQVATRGADAFVVTSMGRSVRAGCSRCDGRPLIDGSPLNGRMVEIGAHELTARSASGEIERAFFRNAEAPAIAVHLNSVSSSNGTLVVETNVDGATVSIDRRGQRPMAGGRLAIPLEPRDYRIQVRKAGYRATPDHLVARVRKGDQFRAEFRLEALPGGIAITGALEGATVLIDGAAAGTVRGSNFTGAVEPGNHTVSLAKEGFKTSSAQRSFQPGETVRLDGTALPMEPIPPAPKPPAPPTAEEIEARDWAAVRSGRDQASLQTFLQKHPDSTHKSEAQRMLAQLEWDAVDRRDRTALERFAARYRGTPFADQAGAEIARLDRESAAAAAAAANAAAAKKAEEQAGADRNEITRVLGMYATAFEKKDLKLLKSVWPGLPEDSLAKAFRDKGEIRSQLRALAPAELAGDHATVRCTRITEQATQFGRQKPLEEPRTVHLRKESGRWIISAID